MWSPLALKEKECIIFKKYNLDKENGTCLVGVVVGGGS